MTGKGWDHSNSAILHGVQKLYENTQDPRYRDYVKAYADAFIQPDSSIKGLRDTLDGMHPGILCLFLYKETGDERYRKAAQTMRDHLIGTTERPSPFQKTAEGGYWHKQSAKYQDVMTVDGTYMAYPFLV